MTATCKNCDNTFTGKFCNNCGQSAATHKINLHFLWHDIQHGLFHFEGGILYSAKELFTRPGHSIREFLEGKHVKHIKPLSLLVIVATVYGLLYHSLHINPMTEFKTNTSQAERAGLERVNDWLATHFSWAMLFTLPFYALASFLAFKKQKYNFVEHLVLNAFIASQKMINHIVTLPVLYVCIGSPYFKVVIGALTVVDIILLGWTYAQFFNALNKAKSILLTLLTLVIFFISVSLVTYPLGLFLNHL